jgi:hypothetical protein
MESLGGVSRLVAGVIACTSSWPSFSSLLPSLFVSIRFSDDRRFEVFGFLFLVILNVIIVVVGRSRGGSKAARPGIQQAAPTTGDVRIHGGAGGRGGSLEQPPPSPLHVTLSFQGNLKRVWHRQPSTNRYLERLPHPFRALLSAHATAQTARSKRGIIPALRGPPPMEGTWQHTSDGESLLPRLGARRHGPWQRARSSQQCR